MYGLPLWVLYFFSLNFRYCSLVFDPYFSLFLFLFFFNLLYFPPFLSQYIPKNTLLKRIILIYYKLPFLKHNAFPCNPSLTHLLLPPFPFFLSYSYSLSVVGVLWHLQPSSPLCLKYVVFSVVSRRLHQGRRNATLGRW